MALFTEKKKEESARADIPPEIFSAVRVMKDRATPPSKSSEPRAKAEVPARAPANLPVGSAPQSSSPASPFLGGSSAPRPAPAALPVPPAITLKIPPQAFTPPPAPTRVAIPQASSQFERPKTGSFARGRVLSLVAGLVLLVLLGGATYYFWLGAGAPESPEGPLPTETFVLPEEGADAALRTLPYALDGPNYLSLDPEAAETAMVRQNLDEAATRIAGFSVSDPIEFIVTDQNNNPLAFSRFAYLLKLALPEELLNQLEENFSLYLASQAGAPAYGLKLTLRDPGTAAALITRHETTLPKAFEPLLYNGRIAIPAQTSFTPSPMKAGTAVVRYHNYSLEPNVSFDYSVMGNLWYIGTSKDMFRALLEQSAQ